MTPSSLKRPYTYFLAASIVLLPALSCQSVGRGVKWAAGFAMNLLAAANGNYSAEYAEQVDEFLDSIATSLGLEDSEENGDGTAIELDTFLLRQEKDSYGKTHLVPIKDGDVLTSGPPVSDITDYAGDRFRIEFRVNQECHVYVVGIDSTGWVTPLFPSKYSRHSNPVQKDQWFHIPDETHCIALNQQRGIEHVFFIASKEMPAKIDSLVRGFKNLIQPPSAFEHRVSEPAIVERGVDDVVEKVSEKILSDDGGKTMLLTSFISSYASDDMVVTRWFRHE